MNLVGSRSENRDRYGVVCRFHSERPAGGPLRIDHLASPLVEILNRCVSEKVGNDGTFSQPRSRLEHDHARHVLERTRPAVFPGRRSDRLHRLVDERPRTEVERVTRHHIGKGGDRQEYGDLPGCAGNDQLRGSYALAQSPIGL